jgi:hypothetical protein
VYPTFPWDLQHPSSKSTTLQDIQQKSTHWHFDTWIPGSLVVIANRSSWFSEWLDPLMPFLPFPHPLAQAKSANVRHTTIPSQCAFLIKLKGASINWCLHLYCHHCCVITIIILPPVTAKTTSELPQPLKWLQCQECWIYRNCKNNPPRISVASQEQSNLQLISQCQFSHLTATTIHSSHAVCFLPS